MPLSGFVKRLQNGQLWKDPRNGSQDDEVHPPIHPLKLADNTLSYFEKEIFDLLTRHFLACMTKDAVGNET